MLLHDMKLDIETTVSLISSSNLLQSPQVGMPSNFILNRGFEQNYSLSLLLSMIQYESSCHYLSPVII